MCGWSGEGLATDPGPVTRELTNHGKQNMRQNYLSEQYRCAQCGAVLIPSASGRYSMCSDLHCDSKLLDQKLPDKVAKRHLASVNCDARDASYDAYSQAWLILPDTQSYDLVKKINRRLTRWPSDVPRGDVIALIDGSTPAHFEVRE